MIMINCIECKSKAVIQGYREVKLYYSKGDRRKRSTKEWCKDCLTKYAHASIKFALIDMPKLRDTNIKEYHENYQSGIYLANYNNNFRSIKP